MDVSTDFHSSSFACALAGGAVGRSQGERHDDEGVRYPIAVVPWIAVEMV
jgi:hypothetical protein